MSEALVTISNISKTFPGEKQPALSDINAVIPQGQMVGLAGPDGAGKTTLIRLIVGLLLPSQGTINVAGFDTVKEAEKIHARIGYMPQKFGLYEDLTVMENLNLYADLKGVHKDERKKSFDELLSFTALAPFTDRLAKALSGGMKQKLGLACALLKKPALMVLDEPSVGVDPISRRELWRMMQLLLQEGISVIWSTAYLDEAEKCDTVLLLSDGKMLYHGAPEELTKRVEGRTFHISQATGNKRVVLEKALNHEDVLDGVIQGSHVRLVLRKEFSNYPGLKATPPRFEDAFMDALGGGPGGRSILAEKTPQIKQRSESVVEARNLTKRFGAFTAANHINFNIKSGEVFGLLGPNGAGKSTTFKMLCGLLKPTEGEAFVIGLDLQKAPAEARQRIGYMAQKFSLYGNLSTRQNLEFFSGIYNLTGKVQREAINEMVDIFNLKPYLDVSADLLPLGFKQRLALSCAVMHKPEVLFLDEPTSGVDPVTRREFWNHINGLVEKGVTVMVTTHFMDEAEYCDRIALIYKSQVINFGTPEDLKQLAHSENHPEPTLEDAFVKLIEQYDAK